MCPDEVATGDAGVLEMMDERHLAMKRWERARQRAVLEREPVLRGPAAICRVRNPVLGLAETAEREIPVFIVEIFAKDLVCVKACEEPAPVETPAPFWMVRGGISWTAYLPRIVGQYRLGLPVPPPFQPRRKLGGELIARLESLPAALLPEVFAKLREAGLLPTPRLLSQATCPSILAWDRMRSLFQDFREDAGTREDEKGPTQG